MDVFCYLNQRGHELYLSQYARFMRLYERFELGWVILTKQVNVAVFVVVGVVFWEVGHTHF